MAAKIVTVSPGLIWPVEAERLWFFPDGSEYLRYAPHFHVFHNGGFRQNLPLTHMFVVVLDGKLSIKNYTGYTLERIDVRDHVWFARGSESRAKGAYAMTLPGDEAYARRTRRLADRKEGYVAHT